MGYTHTRLRARRPLATRRFADGATADGAEGPANVCRGPDLAHNGPSAGRTRLPLRLHHNLSSDTFVTVL